MILVIDNYDSFTWNLVDIVRRGPFPVEVFRNDEITVEEIFHKDPKGILISPGPGHPTESKVSKEIVDKLLTTTPVLGICLGHQLLGEAFGMKVIHSSEPMHGKTSRINHNEAGLFRGIPSPMTVMRYHSLILQNADIPPEITVTAETEDGEIMGIKHNFLNFAGVQFHPESILTDLGEQIVRNWFSSL